MWCSFIVFCFLLFWGICRLTTGFKAESVSPGINLASVQHAGFPIGPLTHSPPSPGRHQDWGHRQVASRELRLPILPIWWPEGAHPFSNFYLINCSEYGLFLLFLPNDSLRHIRPHHSVILRGNSFVAEGSCCFLMKICVCFIGHTIFLIFNGCANALLYMQLINYLCIWLPEE